MAEAIKFSYIIPTYNRAHTINRTIVSILNQTYNSYEIIVVDDGSKDATDVICEKYRQMYNFQYYYQKNAGVACARNKGADLARGEYLIFLDSDDCITPNQLDSFNRALSDSEVINENIGIVFSSYKQEKIINGKIHQEERKSLLKGRYENFLQDFCCDIQATLVGNICIRKDIFLNSIKFIEGSNFGEDQALWVYLSCHEIFYSIPEVTFKYIRNSSDSLMSRKIINLPSDIKLAIDILKNVDLIKSKKIDLEVYLNKRFISFAKIAIKQINILLFVQLIKTYAQYKFYSPK